MQAVLRIQEIANNLLQANKNFKQVQLININQQHFIFSAINLIVNEKYLQYKHNKNVLIQFKFVNAYNLFVNINLFEFKCVLSNLIDNAAEALSENGKIDILLDEENDWIKTHISDNGKGMLPYILSQIGQKGFTYGKSNGSGLGVYHAKHFIINSGGKFSIESRENFGTSITLCLPKSEPSSWIAKEIFLQQQEILIILDDEEYIHTIWKNKIQQLNQTANAEIQLRQFYRIIDCKNWLKECKANLAITFLFDNDLGNKEIITGLDIIAELDIADKSLLVTSKYDDVKIVQRSEELGVKIVPKELAFLIPITIANSEKI